MKVKFNQFKTKLTRNSDSKGSNIMKKNRKLTALLVAACMTIPMAATTFTVPMMASAGSITINAPAGYGYSEFFVYQVFKGHYSSTTSKLAVTGWGDNINVTDFITALKGDSTIGGDFSTVAVENSSATATQVAEIIGAYGNDSVRANAFARLAGANIKLGDSGDKKTKLDAYDSGNVGANSGESKTISNLDDGYYVLVELYAPSGGNYSNTARTLGLLNVVGGDITVSPKRSYPTIEKKIVEEDAVYDVADYCIGDIVDFKITGTLPDTLDDYGAYYYLITDTLGTEFDAPTAENVTVKVGDNTIDQDTDKNCRVNVSGNTITVSFEDITAYTNVTSASKVEVTYSAKLNNQATVGETGQTNTATLTYLCNPNIDYNPITTDENVDVPAAKDNTNEEPNTTTTPGDVVKVLTYQLDIEKVDAQNSATKLANAKFKLKNNDDKYAQVTDGKISGWGEESLAHEFVSDENGIINIIGLDEGTYSLEETVAPEGYNVLPEALTVVITANTQNNTSDPIDNTNNAQNLTVQVNGGTAVEGLEANDNYTGVLKIQVANNKGATLPSTGGIGTKIFYILGGTLVIGSGAALVIKKRMGKDEE